MSELFSTAVQPTELIAVAAEHSAGPTSKNRIGRGNADEDDPELQDERRQVRHL